MGILARSVRFLVVFFAALAGGASAQVLNMSHDLLTLGIAASNIVPNQPNLDSGPLLFQAVAYANQHQLPLLITDRGVCYFLSLQNANYQVASVGITT